MKNSKRRRIIEDYDRQIKRIKEILQKHPHSRIYTERVNELIRKRNEFIQLNGK